MAVPTLSISAFGGMRQDAQIVVRIMREYEKYASLCEADPEMAFVRARRIVEILIRCLHGLLLREPSRTEPLERLIADLSSKNLLPDGVYGELTLIKDYGNAAAHGTTVAAGESLGSSRSESIDRALKHVIQLLFQRHQRAWVDADERDSLVIRRGEQIGAAGMQGLFKLAQEVYGSAMIRDGMGMLARYEANPEIFLAVYDLRTESYAAFLSAVPLDEVGFAHTLEEQFSESNVIPSRVVRFDLPGSYQIYIASVAVSPRYRKTLAYARLVYGFIDFLLELAERDIVVTHLSADAISPAGNEICAKFGLKKQHLRSPQSCLYLGKLVPMELNLLGDAAKRLKSIYERLVL